MKALLAVSLLLAGCACGPSHWAVTAEMGARCGMTPEEVGQIAGHKVEKVDLPDFRRTHVVRDGGTDLWLVFDQTGGLKSVQVAWAYQPTRMARSQRLELCPSSK